MALVRHSILKINSFVPRVATRFYSDVKEKHIKKSVFISQSKDIYTNLALEDWLYKNFDFTGHHVLLLWQNDPCVVIGHNQNPWLEANCSELPHITDNGVSLARRNGCGGAVYNDIGSLNMSFFTTSERYNGTYNLEVVRRALFREFGIKVDISPKEDLHIRDYKISETATKLGRTNSYHHCALMVNSNKHDLTVALQKPEADISINGPQPIKCHVMNLCDENPRANVPSLVKAIGWEFMRTRALTIKDDGMKLAKTQKGFQMVNPTESWFPGLNKIREHLKSWKWCFGTTPKFTISKSFPIPDSLIGNHDRAMCDLKITMVVDNGIIEDVNLFIPPGMLRLGFAGEAKVLTTLKGQKFSVEALNSIESALGGYTDHKEKFVTECLKQVVSSI